MALTQEEKAAAEFNPDAVYLKAYMTILDAEKLEGKQDFAAAFEKYRAASDLFEAVATSAPNWQTAIVGVRRGLVRKKMEEVQLRERNRRTGTEAPETRPPAAPLPLDPTSQIQKLKADLNDSLLAQFELKSRLENEQAQRAREQATLKKRLRLLQDKLDAATKGAQ